LFQQRLSRYLIRSEVGLNNLLERVATEAVKVVRCKDCCYWNDWDTVENDNRCSCAYLTEDVEEAPHMIYTSPMDYCSFGERKVQ